jgi:hypothetical protein
VGKQVTLLKRKSVLLFLVILLHVTLLDLFFVLSSGPVFLWDKNSEWQTIATHLLIAVATLLFYQAISKTSVGHGKQNVMFQHYVFVILSLVGLFFLGLYLI